MQAARQESVSERTQPCTGLQQRSGGAAPPEAGQHRHVGHVAPQRRSGGEGRRQQRLHSSAVSYMYILEEYKKVVMQQGMQSKVSLCPGLRKFADTMHPSQQAP